MDLLKLLSLALGISGAVASLLLAQRAKRALDEDLPDTVEERIENVRRLLKHGAAELQELEAETQLRLTALKKLKAEAEAAEHLANLNKDQARAIQDLVEAATSKGSRKGQLFSFFAGLAVSIPLGLAVNYLYDLLAGR